MSNSPNRPPFDSNRAWSDAVAMVSANREVLAALAGVFLVVPAFAIATLLPPPEPQDGATMEAMFATMGEYYRSNILVLVGMALLHMIGGLAMLALFTDDRRPTVGEAIRHGFQRTPTVIAAQLILGAGIGAMVLLPVTLGGAAQSPGFSLLALLAAAGLGIWAWTRLSLISPAVMVERLGNPIAAMKRSWSLTEGNALRLLAFYVLVGIAFAIVVVLAEGATRLVVTLLAGDRPGDIVGLLASSLMQAAMTVYFVAISAAAHRQLAGPSTQSVVDKFE